MCPLRLARIEVPSRGLRLVPWTDQCSRVPDNCAPAVDGGWAPAVGLNRCFTGHPFIQLYIFYILYIL
jgi:hypothetical protein